jgi:hypothetical protein
MILRIETPKPDDPNKPVLIFSLEQYEAESTIYLRVKEKESGTFKVLFNFYQNENGKLTARRVGAINETDLAPFVLTDFLGRIVLEGESR